MPEVRRRRLRPESMPGGFTVFVGHAVDPIRPDLVLVRANGELVGSAARYSRLNGASPSVLVTDKAFRRGEVNSFLMHRGNAIGMVNEALPAIDEAQLEAAWKLGVNPINVAVMATGALGMPVPREEILQGIMRARPGTPDEVANAFLTTDRVEKVTKRVLSNGAILLGIAKGSYMMSPQLQGRLKHATMLVTFLSDADVPSVFLEKMLNKTSKNSFETLNIDSSSPNDTVLALTSGVAGPVDLAEFESALLDASLDLTTQLQSDAEFSTKNIDIYVYGDRSVATAEDLAVAHRLTRRIGSNVLISAAISANALAPGDLMAAIRDEMNQPPGMSMDRLALVSTDAIKEPLWDPLGMTGPYHQRAGRQFHPDTDFTLRIRFDTGVDLLSVSRGRDFRIDTDLRTPIAPGIELV